MQPTLSIKLYDTLITDYSLCSQSYYGSFQNIIKDEFAWSEIVNYSPNNELLLCSLPETMQNQQKSSFYMHNDFESVHINTVKTYRQPLTKLSSSFFL